MLGFSIVFGGLNEFNQINAQPEMRWKPQAGCCENKRELEFNTQILNQKKRALQVKNGAGFRAI